MRLKLYRPPGAPEMVAPPGEAAAPAAAPALPRAAAPQPARADATRPDEPGRAAALAWHGVPAGLAARLTEGALDEALAIALPFGELPAAPGGKPLLLAGPPGAGKTLTVARLATRLVLAGQTPMVITADGRRAGATEQLAAFTRLLGLNLLVASHPLTLGRALARRQDQAPVLIDSPGFDPFDPAQRDELAALAAVAEAEIVLVLPAGHDPGESADNAAAFAEAGAHALVFTRLDLARRIGGIPAAAAAGLVLTEAGTGPGAADGLVALTPLLLADRLLRVREPGRGH